MTETCSWRSRDPEISGMRAELRAAATRGVGTHLTPRLLSAAQEGRHTNAADLSKLWQLQLQPYTGHCVSVSNHCIMCSKCPPWRQRWHLGGSNQKQSKLEVKSCNTPHGPIRTGIDGGCAAAASSGCTKRHQTHAATRQRALAVWTGDWPCRGCRGG